MKLVHWPLMGGLLHLVPHGGDWAPSCCTKWRTNDFKLVINDLTFNTCYAKYVDDTTVLSVSKDVCDVTLQTAADYLVSWAHNNGMTINTNKTKELIIILF